MIRVAFLFALLLFSAFSCSKEEEEYVDPLERFPAPIVQVDAPATAIVGVITPIDVHYVVNNGCGYFGRFETEGTGYEQEIFTIADAKRGDIGNTSELYARAFFETMNFDSVTVAPYMGSDSVKPFLVQGGKWVILLALTSNPGSQDFQMLRLADGSEEYLWEQVLRESSTWGTAGQLMYVVGATQAEYVQRVRAIVPDHFLLVPGVGAQGGSLEEISRLGMNQRCGLLVNSSRAIIYASSGRDFAEKAREAAQEVQREMEQYLEQYVQHL